MKPTAYLTHSAPGRYRLKVPSKRHDSTFFDNLETELSAVTGVERITVNTTTASVLIEYESGAELRDKLMSWLGSSPYFELTSEPKPMAVWKDASRRLSSVDAFIKDSSGGQVDFRSILFVAFVLMAVRQLQQGAVFGAASNLLWYATQLIMDKK
ncbi:MAG: hypothetical protein PVJ39_07960 [Gammaproteobacteria bacterium]|jgi:hypothetical protein